MFRTSVAMEKTDISNSGKLVYSPKEIHYTKAEKIPNYQPALPLCVTLAGYHRLNHITCCKKTNRYADQYIEKEDENLKPRFKVYTWNGTLRNEMYTLIALLLLMGVVCKPRLHLYWSRDEIYHQVIARDRFFLMIKFFHLANRPYKIR